LLRHESLRLVPFSLPLLGVSLEDFSFARTWVLPSCAIFSPFVGCFVLLMISKFSSFKSKVKILEKDFSMMYHTIWALHCYTLPMIINHFIFFLRFSMFHYY
jgi:hypothetical protein